MADMAMKLTQRTPAESVRVPPKDDAPGKYIGIRPPFTLAHACQSCGRIGSPRYVQERGDCWWGNWRDLRHMRYADYWVQMPVCEWLCMACWNKIRPFFYRIRELAALRTLARRLRYVKHA